MTTILAKLFLYKDARKTPFHNGYRPTFDFGKGLTSGRILLLNERESFFPGDEDEVKVNFLFKEFLGEKFKIGEKIVFTEGLIPIGQIEILDILIE